ncbi:hypothetical protein MRS44_013410 [Fusarium solani]|uniref:uncharacterized protein n=1 Tax=Fusarium solani TaxID=169388 RepID=UPI0032C481C6|nr:hypothetical protein MRS44_013410 [Fusarium solani]
MASNGTSDPFPPLHQVTHLSDAWRPQDRHTTVDGFRHTLDQACSNFYGQDKQRPSADDKIRSLTARVWRIFSSYRYDVLVFLLRSGGNEKTTLEEELERLMRGLQRDDLAIVYYIGHSESVVGITGNTHLYLGPTTRYTCPLPLVDFSQVRRGIIDPAAPDVLMLLDCSSAVGRSIGHGKELISASTFNQHRNQHDFSTVLIQILEEAVQKQHVLTTAQLYNCLTANAVIKEEGMAKLSTMPYYHHRHEEDRRQIFLAPMFPPKTWTCGPVLSTFMQPVNVILHLYLRDAIKHTLRELRIWLRHNVILYLGRIEIKEMFQALPESMIAIIRVTLDVWYSMPENPAIMFIRFEQNTNIEEN